MTFVDTFTPEYTQALVSPDQLDLPFDLIKVEAPDDFVLPEEVEKFLSGEQPKSWPKGTRYKKIDENSSLLHFAERETAQGHGKNFFAGNYNNHWSNKRLRNQHFARFCGVQPQNVSHYEPFVRLVKFSQSADGGIVLDLAWTLVSYRDPIGDKVNHKKVQTRSYAHWVIDYDPREKRHFINTEGSWKVYDVVSSLERVVIIGRDLVDGIFYEESQGTMYHLSESLLVLSNVTNLSSNIAQLTSGFVKKVINSILIADGIASAEVLNLNGRHIHRAGLYTDNCARFDVQAPGTWLTKKSFFEIIQESTSIKPFTEIISKYGDEAEKLWNNPTKSFYKFAAKALKATPKESAIKERAWGNSVYNTSNMRFVLDCIASGRFLYAVNQQDWVFESLLAFLSSTSLKWNNFSNPSHIITLAGRIGGINLSSIRRIVSDEKFSNLVRKTFEHNLNELAINGNHTYYGRDLLADTHKMMDSIDSFISQGKADKTIWDKVDKRDIKDLKSLHDQLVQIYNTLRYQNYEIDQNFYAFLTNPKIPDTILEIVPPPDTNTIRNWGQVQNHCIGSYAEQAYAGQLMILGVRNTEDNSWIGHLSMKFSEPLSKSTPVARPHPGRRPDRAGGRRRPGRVHGFPSGSVEVNGKEWKWWITQFYGKHNSKLPLEVVQAVGKHLSDAFANLSNNPISLANASKAIGA